MSHRLRGTLIGAGAATMTYAVIGAVTDRDVNPVGVLIFLAGVLIAHDALLLPLLIGLGALLGRVLPPPARTPARLAGVVTVALLVVAVPLAFGFGRRPDDPSALPQPYGRNLVVVLAALWIVTALVVALRRWRGRVLATSRERVSGFRGSRPAAGPAQDAEPAGRFVPFVEGAGDDDVGG